ncbi:MAG: hypothetical protein J6333_05620 [Planctomycetes bacterium]|nr:hypothetical protein [Planctomycetota bacterium]
MAITSAHLVGAAVGVGVTVAGYYLYRKHQDQIDEFLRGQGLNIPVNENKPLAAMTLEELSMFKEKIEDAIAEREVAVAK